MQTDKQLVGPGIWTWVTPVLIAAVSLVWYYVVVRADGEIWVSQRLTQVQGMLWPVAGALAAAWITGGAIGAATAWRNRPWVTSIGALAVSASFLALLGFLARWEKLVGAPDWLAVSATVFGGGCFAAGYAFPARSTTARPIWPVLVLPILFVGIIAVRTGNLGDLVALTLLPALFVAVGQAVLVRIGASKPSFPVAGAVGLSLLILLFRVTGACGWVTSNGILITLAATAIGVRRELLAIFSDSTNTLRASREFRVSEWVVFGAGLGLALVFCCSSLAPETGPDAVAGRSASSLIWERSGFITGVPELFATYMGLGGEIFNLIALPLAGENVAKITTLISTFFLIGCIAGDGSGNRRLLPWLACFVFLSSTVVSWQFLHGFVDLHMTFLVVASVQALESWISDRKNSWLLVSGLIAGTAVAVKMNAGTMCILLAGWVLFECRTQRGWFRAAGTAMCLLGIGVAIGLVPSAIRSYVLTGNPVFPFANSIFPSSLTGSDYGKGFSSYGYGLSLKTFALPFRTVLTPGSYVELGTYHPANWLLTLFAIALWPWSGTKARRWWVAAAAFWIGWILTEQNLRYSLPALACTAAAIANSGSSPGVSWLKTYWTGLAIVGLGVVLGYSRPTAWMWNGTAGPAFPREFLLGEQKAEQFLATYLPTSILSKKVNAEFGSKAVVWQVPFTRDHLSFVGRTISHPHGDIRELGPLSSILPGHPQGGSDETIRRVLKSVGITHVVWDTTSTWINGHPESEWTGLFSPRFAEKYFELDAAQTGATSMRLYRVRSDVEIQKGPSKFVVQPWTGEEITVRAGSLLGVEVKWSSSLPSGAFFDLSGWSADGRRLTWNRVFLAYTAQNGWHRQWQTIPDGVTKFHIYISPEAKGVEYAIVRPSS